MSLENPIRENNKSELEDIKISDLTFKQLQEARELGLKTLKKTEEGFMNIAGKEIRVDGAEGSYLLIGCNEKDFPGIERLLLEFENKELLDGSLDKEKMLQKIEEILLSLDYNIVEK